MSQSAMLRVETGRVANMGKRAVLFAGAWLLLASACGGMVRRDRLDDDGAGGIGGSGVVPPPAGGGGAGTQGAGGIAQGNCGKVVCSPSEFMGERLPSCCAEAGHDQPGASRCGIQTGAIRGMDLDLHTSCEPQHQPGVLDATCVNLAVSVAGSTSVQQGCCRTDVGVCGFQMDQLGPGLGNLDLGCVGAAVSRVPPPVTFCGRGARPHYLACD